MCVNDRKGAGEVNMQAVEASKLDEFKVNDPEQWTEQRKVFAGWRYVQ